MSTRIDPKAPADSPLHPSNFRHDRQERPDPELMLAAEWLDLIEHYGTDAERDAADRGEDGPALDDLRKRKIQHDQEAAEFDRLAGLYGPTHARLLVEFGTSEERAPGAELGPSLVLMDRAGSTIEVRQGTGTATLRVSGEPEQPKRPPRDSRRPVWEAYAKALDPDLTDEDIRSLTVDGLRETTAIQDGTAQADT